MDVIEINRRKFSNQKETQIVEDVIVPDVKEDLVSIIDVNGIAYAYKIEKSSGKIKLDGNLECYIVYISSSGDTRGIGATFNFSNFIESSEIKEEMILKYKIDIQKIEAKILNERKLNLTANISISYELYEKQKIEIYNEFENVEDLQLQSQIQTLNSVVGINVGKAQIKEEIKVPDMDNVAEILKTNIIIKNNETKVSYNKVLAKAEAEIFVMYLTEDNRISTVNITFPIMSFIDLENIKEENYCNIDYQIKNILFKVKSEDTHLIECQIDFELMCEAYEKRDIQIVSDLYSLKNDLEFETKEIETECILPKSENPVNILERIEVEDIKKVLYVDVKSKIISNNISAETSNIEGEIELKIYYEVTSKMGLNVKIVTVPFITKIPKLEDDIEAIILKKEFDIEGNEVIIKLNLNIESIKARVNKIKMVSNVSNKKEISREDYSVVVYFVKSGDSLWKIAKNFRVTVDSLVKVNELENPDIIYPGDKLYIVK
jgi:LysM repeat protein